jgi:hypothetical protein
MAKVTQDFRFTGAAQTFTVPAYVTAVYFELWGAPGGQGAFGTFGGFGISGSSGALAYNNGYAQSLIKYAANTKSLVGYVAGTLPVSSGDSFGVYVGGAGGYGNTGNVIEGTTSTPSTTNYGPGGWNGGGNGGYSDISVGFAGSQLPGNGGGGATDIRSGGTALSNRIAVAGGGGGGGGTHPGSATENTATANPTTPDPPYTNDTVPGSGAGDGPNYFPTAGPSYGGNGGGVTGGTGGGASRGSTLSVANSQGKGGSQTAGGAGGTATGTWGEAGSAGAVGTGGTGAHVTTADFTGSSDAFTAGGGGGGGGYYGGGGGASGSETDSSQNFATHGAGGGGGSNYLSGSFTGTASYAHVPPAGIDGQVGVNGLARVTYTQPPNPPAISTPNDQDFININEALVVEWSFSSLASGAVQGGFDVGYSVHAADSWTLLLNPTSTNNFLSIPAGTFTGGTAYDIRVRVYDQYGDVSSYTIIEVQAIDVPGAPTITSPADGATLSTNPFTVDWTVDAGVTETIYRVKALDQNGTVQVDSGDLYSSRVNACTNPSFETDTTGWGSVGGITISQSAAHSVIPSHSMKLAWVTAGAFTQAARFPFPTIPGKSYTLSAYTTVDTVGTDPPMLIEALDADGVTQLGSYEEMTPVTAGVFVRGSCTFVAQSTTSYLAIVNVNPTTAGQVGYVDAVLIEYGTNLNGYFDGGNANGNPGTASWQGTANLSVSVLTVANVLSYSVDWPLPSQPITIMVEYADTVDLNLYSPVGTSTPVVNLNPPDAPTVTLTINNDDGTVHLGIVNPPGTFTAIYNEVYRQDLTNGTPEVLVATLSPSTDYTDYTVVTQTLYAYRVRAYSSDGGFADAT